METTCDAFLDGRVLLEQPVKGFRSGLDAVFMAAACRAKAGDHVLEAGCGAGAASLCLLARTPGIACTGVEIDPALADLARRNAQANSFGRDFRIIDADITAPWKTLETLGLARETFDHVMANPPFFNEGTGRLSTDEGRARACVMPKGGLDRWLRFLAAAAKPGGRCNLIHAADVLHDLLSVMEGRFGAIAITPLYPKIGDPAVRILVSGIKGSRAPLSIHPGIVLHEADGSPTPEAKSILRDAKGLRHNPRNERVPATAPYEI